MENRNHEVVIREIRKEFYALRNGMIADTLRKGGLEQKYIFGLQLPQIKATSEKFRPESKEEASEMARSLWGDRSCREARLLACHLMPPESMTDEEAMEWSDDVATREEADILAFRLLRYYKNAREIANTLATSDNPLKKYTATAIERFIN